MGKTCNASPWIGLFLNESYAVHMLTRAYEHLEAYLQPNKMLLIYGPRRAVLPTRLRNYLAHLRSAGA